MDEESVCTVNEEVMEDHDISFEDDNNTPATELCHKLPDDDAPIPIIYYAIM